MAIPLPRRRRHSTQMSEFFRNDRGATTVEYGIVLAVVVACISVSIHCLSLMYASGFEATADAFEPVVKAQDLPQLAQTELTPHASPKPAVSNSVILILGCAVLIGCCTPVAYMMFRHGRKPKVRTERKQEKPTEDVPKDPFDRRQQIKRIFQNNQSCVLNGNVTARHIMSRQVTCVKRSARVKEVSELIEKKRIGHVLVRDNQGKLVGVISHKDILTRDGKKAEDVMTADPYTMDIDAKISLGITQLIGRRVSCLPVLENNGSLAGIITSTDFLLAFQCAIQTLGSVVTELTVTDDQRTDNEQSEHASV